MIRRIWLVLMVSGLAVTGWAHPHMSLETELAIVRGATAVEAVQVSWYMDLYFSTSILGDYDVDDNKVISPAESRAIEREAFSNLKNFGYFMLFRTAAGRFAPKVVSNFVASYEKNRLVYRFTVPCADLNLGREFWVTVFDLSYFCAVTYRNTPVQLIGPETLAVKLARVSDRKNPVFYNPFGRADDKTEYKVWKPGLETAYPEEVHVLVEGS